MGCGYRETCKELQILPRSSQYIFYLVLCVVNNRDYFVSSVVYYNNNTRQTSDLHLHQVTIAMHQKGVYYSGIKIFNGLPKAIKTYLQQT
jgi:hypothetical protein